MSERCHYPGCKSQSKGSVGVVRHCFHHIAVLFGWKDDDPRLRKQVAIQLRDGQRNTGVTAWIPDAAVSRAKAKQRTA